MTAINFLQNRVNSMFTNKATLSKQPIKKLNIITNIDSSKTPTNNTLPSAKAHTSSVDTVFNKLFDSTSRADQDMLKKLNDKDVKVFENFIANMSQGGKPLEDYDVQKMVYTIAAKYTALEHSISTGSFSDQEKDTLQDNLEFQLESGLKLLGDTYGKSTQELFKSLGKENLSTVASSSLINLVHNQIKDFQEIVKSKEGQDFISITKATASASNNAFHDGDLTRTLIEYKATQIVEQEKQEQSLVGKKNNKAVALAPTQIDKVNSKQVAINSVTESDYTQFNLNDLQALGSINKALTTFTNQDLNKSEEQLGLEYGLNLIKAKESIKEHQGSTFLDELITSGYKNYIEQNIDSRNKQLHSKQKANEEFSEENQNKNAYTALNTSTIMSSFNATMTAYERTNDSYEALIQGFESAKASFNLNFQNNKDSIRYQSSKSFFDNFYTSNNKIGFSNYTTKRSDYTSYLYKMDNFR